MTGAKIGPKPERVWTSAKTVSLVFPEKLSLTMAIEIAVTLAAPIPCKTLQNTNMPMFQDIMHNKLAIVYKKNPANNGLFRPYLSLSGPQISIPMA